MRVTFAPYFRKRGKDATNGTVYIRITVERLHIYRPVFLYPTEKDWNDKAKKIRTGAANSEHNNAIITQCLAETERLYLEHRLHGGIISYSELSNLYGKRAATTSLLKDVLAEYLQLHTLSLDRVRHWNVFLNMSGKLGLPANMQATTSEHAGKFLQKLQTLGYAPNTATSYIKRAKTLFGFALQKGYIRKNPMDEIKSGKWQVNRKFLEVREVKLIETSLPRLSAELQNVARLFLFACYTGLRFSDLFKVKRESLVVTPDGYALDYVQQKTKKQRVLPLLPQAVDLIQRIQWQPVTNQYYNSCLKEIAKTAHITKVLTSHIARHTFATIGLNAGMTMEAVQAYLGHERIETTMGYAHLKTSTLAKELHKWNENGPGAPADFIHGQLKADGSQNWG